MTLYANHWCQVWTHQAGNSTQFISKEKLKNTGCSKGFNAFAEKCLIDHGGYVEFSHKQGASNNETREGPKSADDSPLSRVPLNCQEVRQTYTRQLQQISWFSNGTQLSHLSHHLGIIYR